MHLMRKLIHAYRLLKLASAALGELPDLPTITDLDAYIRACAAGSMGRPEARALDIGCGSMPKNPFRAEHVFGLDLTENDAKNVRRADLTIEPIPFADDSFDYITAFDFIEHIPRVIYAPTRRFPFVELMNEIWRTLKPGGIFLSFTPMFPHSPAFRDPTHVNILSHETFPQYFDNRSRLAKVYGFSGFFEILGQATAGPHLISLLRKTTGEA
jgi:SAM-dependent methyltransferase